MTGRVWPSAGTGGTLSASGVVPGPFYVLAAAGQPIVGLAGRSSPDVCERAVWFAVRAIQRCLNRQLGGDDIKPDGLFGPATSTAVRRYQRRHELTVDGVVGRDTAQALFLPVINRLATSRVPSCLLVGQLANESAFDPGAVGYVDDRDLGLAQINGRWHPDMSEDERFSPVIAVDYVIGLYEQNLSALDNNLTDAVAAYNLGLSGAGTWIDRGRPDVIDYYTSGPVYVRDYITRILSGCPAGTIPRRG